MDQVFEAAVRSKIAILEKACDGWRKEALELNKEVESLRQQLADIQAKYDAREQECRTAFGKEMELRKQLDSSDIQ